MTARGAYRKLLGDDSVMQELGFIEDRIYGANAVDTPGETPFIVIRSDGDEKAFGMTSVNLPAFWVHVSRTRSRDYWIIDEAIERIKLLMTTAEHVVGDDGSVLTSASWVDSSPDLVDDGYNTLTRYATFRAATRSIVTP